MSCFSYKKAETRLKVPQERELRIIDSTKKKKNEIYS